MCGCFACMSVHDVHIVPAGHRGRCQPLRLALQAVVRAPCGYWELDKGSVDWVTEPLSVNWTWCPYNWKRNKRELVDPELPLRCPTWAMLLSEFLTLGLRTFYSNCFSFEIESCCTVQVSLELVGFLPQSPNAGVIGLCHYAQLKW